MPGPLSPRPAPGCRVLCVFRLVSGTGLGRATTAVLTPGLTGSAGAVPPPPRADRGTRRPPWPAGPVLRLLCSLGAHRYTLHISPSFHSFVVCFQNVSLLGLILILKLRSGGQECRKERDLPPAGVGKGYVQGLLGSEGQSLFHFPSPILLVPEL